MGDSRWQELIRAGDAAGFEAARADTAEPPSLDAASFNEVRIVDFDLSGVDLSNCEWNHCAFERVQFGDADLSGAYFDHTTLTDCSFDGTDLSGTSFDGGHLLRTTIANANMADSEFEGCELIACELRDLVLEEVSWNAVSATRSRFVRVEGRSGELSSVTLREATFDAFDTSGLTCERCRASVLGSGDLPAGFSPLSGRRRTVR